MKNKKICRVISAGLGFVMVCAYLLGCSNNKDTVVIEPMEAEESFSLSYDVIGGDDEITRSRLKAFLGPWPRALEVAGLKEVKDMPKKSKKRKKATKNIN